jgi:hypothetical protein
MSEGSLLLAILQRRVDTGLRGGKIEFPRQRSDPRDFHKSLSVR